MHLTTKHVETYQKWKTQHQLWEKSIFEQGGRNWLDYQTRMSEDGIGEKGLLGKGIFENWRREGETRPKGNWITPSKYFV